MKTNLLIVFLVLSITSFAQDHLLKKDSTKLDIKILEITPTEIKYKLFTYQDGPTISVLKNEVAAIIYKNGQHEEFTNTPTIVAPVKIIEEDPKLYLVRNRTVYDVKIIIDEDYNILLNNYKNKTVKPVLIKNYNEEVDFKKRSTRKFWGTLIAVGVGALLTEGVSNQFYNESKVSYNTGVITATNSDNTKYNVIHTAMFIGLVAAPATLGFTYSYMLKNKAKAIRRKTIEYYNFNLNLVDTIKPKPIDTNIKVITNLLVQAHAEQIVTQLTLVNISKITLLGAKRYTENKKPITERTLKQRLDEYPNTAKRVELAQVYELKKNTVHEKKPVLR